MAVIVKLKSSGASRTLAKGVTVLNPWLLAIEPRAKDPHLTQSDKALFVFHGATVQWTDDRIKGVFLLLDAVYDEISVIKRQAKSAVSLPGTSKGDCILTGTEEAKGIIYWNGKTYVWQQRGD